MGDVCSETFAQIEHMCRAYERLKLIKPDHPLLGLIDVTSKNVHFNPGYFERCVLPTDKHNFQSDGRYTSMLEAACDELYPIGFPNPVAVI
ncbi:MAG: hypothetical protein PHF67_01965 [Candidatus Nanoarchaeia archaeon]|nr:hypothetical protein [Candidatus Nanoarchaeia archaeon]